MQTGQCTRSDFPSPQTGVGGCPALSFLGGLLGFIFVLFEDWIYVFWRRNWLLLDFVFWIPFPHGLWTHCPPRLHSHHLRVAAQIRVLDGVRLILKKGQVGKGIFTCFRFF